MKKIILIIKMIFLIGLAGCSVVGKSPSKPIDLVYPLLDTENSRWFYFSSASRPFGMVNLFPDNGIDGAWSSGYQYDIDTIKGFSHIHGWQISGVSVMPITIENPDDPYFTDYYSKFCHTEEIVEVGYHKVNLSRYDIQAELTSTKRVGFHRYVFPGDKKAAILFNMGGNLGPCLIKEGSLKLIDKNTMAGEMVNSPTIRRPKDFKIFFVVKFDHEVEELQSGKISENVIVHFGDNLSEPVKMKVAISFTSTENAQENLDVELNHWDFEKVVAESKDEWNSLLSRIRIEGNSDDQQRRFYTDLWHSLQGRRIISDVNGAYPDNTGDVFRIGQLPLDDSGKPKFNHYNSDSFWGAQWTLNTLWGIVYPDIYNEFVNSLLIYKNDGGLIPRGPSGGNYTHVMTGASTTPFIVSAIQKGIYENSLDEVYAALKKNHLPGGMMGHSGYEHTSATGGGIENYIEYGYVPYPLPGGDYGFHRDGAGLTLEYSYQDWTLAQLAKSLGKIDDYEYFNKRSKNYKNIYDTESGWMRPKDINGENLDPFDPYEYRNGFVEANAAQSTWFVPHDLPGLVELLGGTEKAVNKLNQQFKEAEKLNFTSGTSHAVEQHPEFRRIPVNYGNQPSMQMAFLFNKMGRPDLTQYWSRRISEEVQSALTTSRGYNGDEDQGLMGALSVLMKIGLFQVNGGTEENPCYEIGSPIFDKVTIKLNNEFYSGENFIIKTMNNNTENKYIKRQKLNDTNLTGNQIKHSDIINGGELNIEMTNKSPDDV